MQLTYSLDSWILPGLSVNFCGTLSKFPLFNFDKMYYNRNNIYKERPIAAHPMASAGKGKQHEQHQI